MATPINQYSHTPLRTFKSIRLIKLLPSSDDIIRFTLEAYELDHFPPFDALSYTWGDPRSPYIDEVRPQDRFHYEDNRYSVICNGSQLMIRRNLHDAFKMLRNLSLEPVGNSRQKYIWIDAICIDQSNLAERESQVEFMGTIFSSASTVIAWIGPEDASTQDALTVVERISSITLLSSEDDTSVADEIARRVTPQDFVDPLAHQSKLGIEPIARHHWFAWVAFLHRPYFKRAWVTQEVTLAKSLLGVCGSKSFNWAALSLTSRFLLMSTWYIQMHTENLRHNIVQGETGIYAYLLSLNLDPGFSATSLLQTRREIMVAKKFYLFRHLLQNHRHCKAADPRDMVYALLGISRKERPPFTEFANLLKPDYNISVEGLYTKITRMMLRSSNDLSFLMLKEGVRSRCLRNLPSWVPDLSVAQPTEPLTRRGPACNWCAQGSLEWKKDNRSWIDPLLDVQGLLIGEVVSVTHQEPGVSPISWLEIYEVASSLAAVYSVDPEVDLENPDSITELQTRIEVIWRTLIADTFLGQHPAPPEAGQQFLAHIITVVRARNTVIANSSMASLKRRMKSKLFTAVGKSLNEKENGAWFTLVASESSTSRYDYPLLEKAMEDLMLASEDSPDETAIQRMRPYYAQYRQEVNIALGSRQLFLTNGGVLGLAPIDTKVGDEVWVLAGCATPVMLRKSASGSRIFLGEAYAHGVMHGEATDLSLDYENLILE